MISGECHVEGIPSAGSSSAADRRLALDGLRLRLDLRIVPSATGGDAAAAAIWRIESDRMATLSLCAPSTFRRAAMLAGVAALALAIGVWFLDSPGAPTEARWESSGPTAGSSPGAAGARAIEAAAPSQAGSALVPTSADAAGAVSAGGNSTDGSGPARAPSSTAMPTRPALAASSVRSTPEPPAIDAASQRPLSVEVTETASAMRAVAPGITALATDTAGSAGSASAGSASTSPASARSAPVEDLRPGAPPASPAAVATRPDAPQRAARPTSGALPPAGSAGASRRAAPAARTSDDMLDLFSDTK